LDFFSLASPPLCVTRSRGGWGAPPCLGLLRGGSSRGGSGRRQPRSAL